MKSAIKMVLGLSLFGALVSSVGCGSSGGGGTAIAIGGSGNTAASGGSGGGGSALPAGIPLTPTDGWLAMASNTLGAQGAMFSYEDDTTKPTVTDTISTGMNCIQGTAAKVDLACTIVSPATDCYGTIWGAAMGLNLNQMIDPTTMMGVPTPLPFDGSKAPGPITGFAFNISGSMVPIASNFRFLINDNTTGSLNQYCSTSKFPVKAGANVFWLKDLIQECWKPTSVDKTGDTAVNNIVKIAWQVVTNATAAIPFNFCVDNIEALTTPPTD